MTAPLWLAERSRFAAFGSGAARAVLAIAVLLMALCLLAPDARPTVAAPDPKPQVEDGPSDLAMYATIAERIRHGGSYYAVTAQELRMGDYPLRPFVTFRPPLLAEIQATLPPPVTRGILYLLIAAVALAWLVRIFAAFPTEPPRIAAALLLGAGLFACVQPILFTSHEVWAALLIALSLALRRRGRWVTAVAIALVAMLIRELSAIYAVLMLGFAWAEGERREAIGWAAAIGVFAAALGAHAWAVAQVVTPLDPTSVGWTGVNGFWFFVQTIRHGTVLEAFPYLVSAPVTVTALIGWASWRNPLALRMLATIAAYGALIGLAARLNNFYWGLMVTPVFLVGLAFAPDGVRDLVRAAKGRRITVTRVAR